jgi:hypothetical protein
VVYSPDGIEPVAASESERGKACSYYVQPGACAYDCVRRSGNINTFTAWIARQVPELELDLPFSAIGKRYVNSLRTSSAAVDDFHTGLTKKYILLYYDSIILEKVPKHRRINQKIINCYHNV